MRSCLAPGRRGQGLYGQTVFYDTTVETEDGPVCVKGGTIILNTSVDYSAAQRSKIIIHECYHYYAHDLFIWGQSLYKDDVACFDCPITLGAYPTGSKSPIFWEEWQAQQITPRIQMHRLTVNAMLDEINERLANGYSPSHKTGMRKQKPSLLFVSLQVTSTPVGGTPRTVSSVLATMRQKVWRIT